MRPEVEHVVTGPAEVFREIALHFEPCMIAGNSNAHSGTMVLATTCRRPATSGQLRQQAAGLV
jgi:hypothetical protein